MRAKQLGCLGILGRGLTGRSAQAYCERYQQPYVIWDQNDVAENDRAASLAHWIARCESFLISPGVSPHKPLYRPLLSQKCFSDIQLFCEKVPPVNFIYVTGSNGKTTTVTLLKHVLDLMGERAHALGNNENPVLRELETVRAGDWVILELSSAQLWWTQQLPQARCVMITSWAPNHLDWHGTLQDYRVSKLKILSWGEKAFCPQELYEPTFGDQVQPWPQQLSPKLAQILENLPESVLETPSRYAAIAVLHTAQALGWDMAAVALAFKTFSLLPYRGERKQYHNTIWVNDSKSTTYAATAALIATLPGQPSERLLILGGVLKGQSCEIFAPLAQQADNILLIGESAAALQQVLGDKSVITHTLEGAFSYIRRLKKRPRWVIFSPGAASLDQFAHYKERGQCFWNDVENFYEPSTQPIA